MDDVLSSTNNGWNETRLDTLPRELLYQISNFLVEKQDLQSLRLVNKAFAAVPDAQLFQSIVVRVSSSNIDKLEKLASCPPLANQVQQLRFDSRCLPIYSNKYTWFTVIQHYAELSESDCRKKDLYPITQQPDFGEGCQYWEAYQQALDDQASFVDQPWRDLHQSLRKIISSFHGLNGLFLSTKRRSFAKHSANRQIRASNLEQKTMIRLKSDLLDIGFECEIIMALLRAAFAARLKIEKLKINNSFPGLFANLSQSAIDAQIGVLQRHQSSSTYRGSAFVPLDGVDTKDFLLADTEHGLVHPVASLEVGGSTTLWHGLKSLNLCMSCSMWLLPYQQIEKDGLRRLGYILPNLPELEQLCLDLRGSSQDYHGRLLKPLGSQKWKSKTLTTLHLNGFVLHDYELLAVLECTSHCLKALQLKSICFKEMPKGLTGIFAKIHEILGETLVDVHIDDLFDRYGNWRLPKPNSRGPYGNSHPSSVPHKDLEGGLFRQLKTFITNGGECPIQPLAVIDNQRKLEETILRWCAISDTSFEFYPWRRAWFEIHYPGLFDQQDVEANHQPEQVQESVSGNGQEEEPSDDLIPPTQATPTPPESVEILQVQDGVTAQD